MSASPDSADRIAAALEAINLTLVQIERELRELNRRAPSSAVSASAIHPIRGGA